MNMWLDTCARRVSELDPAIGSLDAEQVAVRLWYGCDHCASCSHLHPVAAAELWQATLRSTVAAPDPAPFRGRG